MKFKITRSHIINHLIEKYDCKNYLEIGVRKPHRNFDKIKIENKVGVDPAPKTTNKNIYIGTSDDFFQIMKIHLI